MIELLLAAGAVLAAVSGILGALWWLVWPRVEDKLQDVARSVTTHVDAQLDGDRPDSVGGHAKAAAQQLPELRRAVSELAENQAEQMRWRAGVDRRVGSIEQALIALLGTELRGRLADDHDRDTERERASHD